MIRVALDKYNIVLVAIGNLCNSSTSFCEIRASNGSHLQLDFSRPIKFISDTDGGRPMSDYPIHVLSTVMYEPDPSFPI